MTRCRLEFFSCSKLCNKNTLKALQMLIGVQADFQIFRTLHRNHFLCQNFSFTSRVGKLEAIQRGRQIHLNMYQHRDFSIIFFQRCANWEAKLLALSLQSWGGNSFRQKIYTSLRLTKIQNLPFTSHNHGSVKNGCICTYIYILYSFPFMVQWGDFPLNHDLWDKRVTYTPEIRPCKRVFCAEYVFVKLFL